MPNRKRTYKDKNRFRETWRKQKARYRERTGSYAYKRRAWTEEEIDMLFDNSMTDRELSDLIHRSVDAIQTMRSRKRGGE